MRCLPSRYYRRVPAWRDQFFALFLPVVQRGFFPLCLSTVQICLFFSVFPLLGGCENKPAVTPPPPPKVTVGRPVRQHVTDYLDFTGTTQAVNTVQLRARVEGYLEKVHFRDGDIVKKDQPLFTIQQNTYQARLQQAEGNVLTQKARLEHAKNELARFTNLFNQKAAAQTEVENWRFERESAQASLMAAEAQRDLAKLDLAYTRISAPFAGRIDRRLRDPGNLVGSGETTVLAEISQIDPLYVYFSASEIDLSRLAQKPRNTNEQQNADTPVHVGFASEQGFPHKGTLDFTSTTVSSTTGTVLVRGVFPNKDGKMLPGQFARVRVPIGDEHPALLLPQVSVGFDQLGTYVLIVNDKNVVERRNVRKGTTRDNLVVIEEGLSGDDRVVVNGLLWAAPGRPVTPEMEASPGVSPASGNPSGNPDQRLGK